MPTRQYIQSLLLFLIICTPQQSGFAEDIYVNNELGSDILDGAAPELLENASGPLRSISRAVRLARRGDTIHIAKTSKPYYESVSLVGNKHSGWPNRPFVIEGNGAVLSGLQRIPDRAWKPVQGPIWKVVPWRKGRYQLLIDGKQLKRASSIDQAFADLSAGQWTVRNGAIVVHTGLAEEPFNQGYQIAAQQVGITLYRVHDVLIRDLVISNYALDGMNAHDLNRNVVLNKITAVNNARAGITVAGSSDVRIQECKLTNNQDAQLLILEKGIANVQESELSTPPVLRD